MIGVEAVGLGILIGLGLGGPALWHFGPGMKESWQEQTGKIPKGSSATVARLRAEEVPRSARNILIMAFLGVVCLASLFTFGTVDGLARLLHGVICVVTALGIGVYLAYPDRMAPKS